MLEDILKYNMGWKIDYNPGTLFELYKKIYENKKDILIKSDNAFYTSNQIYTWKAIATESIRKIEGSLK